MIVDEGHVFNLMDTNGRRDDVINAIQGYISILNDIVHERNMLWKSMPTSTAQYEFYRLAIQQSPEVLSKHGPYDRLEAEIDKLPEFRLHLDNNNVVWLQTHKSKYSTVLKMFDSGIEDRARHYTSNLVKLGYADKGRNVSSVGRILLGKDYLKRDPLESILPLDDVNVIYLRQLLKLRVFSNDHKRYYSPFCMALLVLLTLKRVSTNKFCELVQGQNPYAPKSDIVHYIKDYNESDIVNDMIVTVPSEVDTNSLLVFDVFSRYFKNSKTDSSIRIYYKFYKALYDFYISKTQKDLDDLLTIYESEKSKIIKAFGEGKSLFSIKRGQRPEVSEFLASDGVLFDGNNLNSSLYIRFMKSKFLDVVSEYSDTTVRILKATGIISFDNSGYVELAYPELLDKYFDVEQLKKRVFGDIGLELSQYYDCYSEYEGSLDSFFLTTYSLSQILEYSDEKVAHVIKLIQKEYNADVDDITAIVADRRRQEFCEYIEKNYTIDKVKRLLSMFSDRKNDKSIQAEVSNVATVPTIYEYIVGIAWYYFSNRTIDLLSSYNLTLSADFEPVSHAGGGKGDIVIHDKDRVIMLEVTLMDPNSQKRGEWEPVLRHSVNLKIDEENCKSGKEVTTFFVADSFDMNTINIWKAVSTVPLQSSFDKDKYTSNVIIMPLTSDELSCLIDKSDDYSVIIKHVRDLFIADESNFDLSWRDKYINTIL